MSTLERFFCIVRALLKFDANLVISSLDVALLLITKFVYSGKIFFYDRTDASVLWKDNSNELLAVTMSELLALFDGGYYQQFDRVVMGSLLGLTLANLFSMQILLPN